ncbi:MAG: hypothetical protein K9K37_04975 [Desulfocapsa sp.]|nr:hypothetical protein [Desulfocapsa sp.]
MQYRCDWSEKKTDRTEEIKVEEDVGEDIKGKHQLQDENDTGERRVQALTELI